MCQACCEPARVQQADAPNRFTLPADGDETIRTLREAMVIPISGGAAGGSGLSVTPEGRSDGATADVHFRVPGDRYAWIPTQGMWRIHNRSSTAVSVLVVEAPCVAAMLAYRPVGYSTPTFSSPSIGTTSTVVVAANYQRTYLLIQNPTARGDSVFIDAGHTAVLNEGIEIVPGGHIELEGGACPPVAFNGIRSVAGDVLVLEG